jgi:hypothetical protein
MTEQDANRKAALKEQFMGRTVYVLTVSYSRTSTGRKVRYFLHTPEKIDDVTGVICRTMDSHYNTKGSGHHNVKGGDGQDLVNSFSIYLFGSSKAINVENL